MKERAIVDCQHCIDELKSCYTEFEIGDLSYYLEQVPETFEELKELCKEIEVDVEEDYIELFGALVGSNILFCKDGAIMLNTDCCFKERATFEQMWNIIKYLTEE